MVVQSLVLELGEQVQSDLEYKILTKEMIGSMGSGLAVLHSKSAFMGLLSLGHDYP